MVVTFVSPMDVNPERLPRKQVDLHNFDPFFCLLSVNLVFVEKFDLYVITALLPA